MKKMKKWNALLSLLLAVTLTFGQAGVVYAAEISDVTTNEEGNDESVKGDVGEDAAIVSDEGTSEDTQVEEEVPAVTDDTEAEDKEEDPVTPAEEAEEVSDELEEENSETEEPAAGENDQETEDPGETMQGFAMPAEKKQMLDDLGFKTKSLDQEMMQEKSVLGEVLSELPSMKSGEDYIENEIMYFTDSEEEAVETAECYGGSLVSFEYGVAVANIERTVEEAVGVAADMKVSIPAVYPNIILSIDGTVDPVEKKKSEVKLIDEADVEHEEVPEEKPEGLEVDRTGNMPYALAPTDPYYEYQWYHNFLGTVDAWDATKGKGVKVAVLDTGIDFTHPDLKSNIAAYESFVTDERGNKLDPMDANGHGTHCAGIIAACQNNEGVVGMAPEATIYSGKVMNDQGRGGIAEAIKGVRWAIEQDVDVISMSLGALWHMPQFQAEINKAANKGIIVVAATGNEAISQKNYPAAYDNVIAVGAIDGEGLTTFSNYGTWMDVAAPGEDILSTVPGGYTYMSGTSMACPLVSGIVALMLENNDTLISTNNKTTVTKVTKALQDSAVTWNKYGVDVDGDDYADGYIPGDNYLVADVVTATYSVDNSEAKQPSIKFFKTNNDGSSQEITPQGKNVVEWGQGYQGYQNYQGYYFEFDSNTPHGKVYFTINGKKPTAKTGERYYDGDLWSLNRSGKVKIQAVTVVGSKVSPVFSTTYTLDVKATSLEPTCKQNMSVAEGKSIQLGAAIYPSFASVTKLKWTRESGNEKITVNAKGKVTCKKGAGTDPATIKATTTDGSEKSVEFIVTPDASAAKNVTIEGNTITLSYLADRTAPNGEFIPAKVENGNAIKNSYQLNVSDDGSTSDQYLYKSSNTKVATVSNTGLIRARGKGKAKITVTANDGSNKKKTFNVTVVNPVWDIYTYSSTGYSGDSQFIPIGTGCSITMKTEINYNTKNVLYAASDKKVKWSVESGSGLTVDQKGKVTCAGGNRNLIGREIPVTVTANDGWGTSQTITFLVTDGIKTLSTEEGYTSAVINSVKVGNSVSPLTVGDIIDDPARVKTEFDTRNAFWSGITMKYSNQDVAYRYYYVDPDDPRYDGWVIAATKAGSTTMTYTTRDGSNKKFTLKVSVKKATVDLN